MKKILINGSNLHFGGSIAVASSFIKELSYGFPKKLSISILISRDINNNLLAMNVDLSLFDRVIVKDYYGISALWQGLHADLTGYDVVFTVFGPAYTLKRISNHIIGFAQPNIIYPDNSIYRSLNFFEKFKTRFKYNIQQYFFSKAKIIVVELEHVQIGIERRGFFDGGKIVVVNSAVDAVFKDKFHWASVDFGIHPKGLKLGIISRNYPHKNLKILPDVKNYLLDLYGIKAEFFVTFKNDEFLGCSEEFKRNINNVGPLALNQCPSFYSYMDGIIFPSLLECFSAVPIEAMMLNKPLFASDLPFIRDSCKNNAIYIDPLDPKSISRSIAFFFSMSETNKKKFISDAYDFVETYPGPDVRASDYLNIIDNL